MLHTRKVVSLSGALFALIMLTATAQAQDSTAKPICKDGTTSTTTGRGACSHHGGVDKTRTTSSGTVAPAPATTPAPATPTQPSTPSTSTTSSSRAGKTGTSETNDPTGAIAKCKDGLYSHSKHHTGACSRHGGVAQWLDSTSTK